MAVCKAGLGLVEGRGNVASSVAAEPVIAGCKT